MIIETSANQKYRVVETDNPDLAHCWMGYPVKRVRGEWVATAKATASLVRKAGCTVIESEG